MKFNKWTLGLAAVGAVSLASAVRADEAKLSALNTALSNTTISGYVDVAAQYNAGNPGKTPSSVGNQPFGLSPSKIDSFSVNNVTISLDKPLDESPWASGYHVDINAGTDAIKPLNSGSTSTSLYPYPLSGTGSITGDIGLRQAYVALRTPVGNGIDWKVGLFDGVTGYESNTGYANPNYTRSYGYVINPASEAGAIASYKINSLIAVQAGIANRGSTFGANPAFFPFSGPIPANQGSVGLSSQDYIAAVALTAPDSWGFLKGSVLNFGTVQGFDNGAVNNYSVNATLNTPVKGLKFGFSYDAAQTLTQWVPGTAAPNLSWDLNIYGVYANYQATDKLAFNVRGEYVDASGTVHGAPNFQEVTATVQYDLWANVVSRLEVRWDHVEHGAAYNNNGSSYGEGQFAASNENAILIALNLVYKF